MKQLFENKQRPLYGSAVPVRLGRLDDADIADYVASRFTQTNRGAGEALGALLATAQGHPQRAIMLAHRLWEYVPAGTAASLEQWEQAHAVAVAEVRPEFDATWRGYQSTVTQKTLRSIVAGDGSAYRTAVLKRLELEKSAASAAVERLLATADIEAAGPRKYRVVDPLYAEWIAGLDAGSDD